MASLTATTSAATPAITSFAPPTYVLASNGPLSTFFTQPLSCLSTTTYDGTNYFMGYQSALGTDSACYPHVLAAPTPTPAPDSNAITLQYYSPGLCPASWSYAMSYVGPGLPGNGAATTTTYVTQSFEGYPESTEGFGPDLTAYLCCPWDYAVSTTHGAGGTAGGAYPMCTRYVADLDAVWRLQPGWPTAVPDRLQLYSYAADNPTADVTACKSFTVLVSGIVVAWHATDTAVASMAQWQLTDPNNGNLPPWPPTYSQPNCGSVVGRTISLGIIAAIVVGAILICGVSLCYIVWRARRGGARKRLYDQRRLAAQAQSNPPAGASYALAERYYGQGAPQALRPVPVVRDLGYSQVPVGEHD